MQKYFLENRAEEGEKAKEEETMQTNQNGKSNMNQRKGVNLKLAENQNNMNMLKKCNKGR